MVDSLPLALISFWIVVSLDVGRQPCLTSGQVRRRNERLCADAQEVFRVLLAVRVLAERVDEAVRTV